ncbi:MAG: response regulator [Chloroflexi bacterium]|nr:MAG: response regulator [Chloroflexota bacterium]
MAGETILIVEDSALNRKLVETVLQPYGYRLLIAVDGKEAIEIATREKPDLILMDIQLPKVSGYEATQTIKAQPETAHIPILALTAHAMTGDRERAVAAGCDDYITKPIDTRVFPDQVRHHLDLRGAKTR